MDRGRRKRVTMPTWTRTCTPAVPTAAPRARSSGVRVAGRLPASCRSRRPSMPSSSSRSAPIAQVGPWSVRLETIALAVVVLVALIAAVRIARTTPLDVRRSAGDRLPPDGEPNHLRADDLLFIAVAAIPGAVAGGPDRLHLLHLDYYTGQSRRDLRHQPGRLRTVACRRRRHAHRRDRGRAPRRARRPLDARADRAAAARTGGRARRAMVLGGDGQGRPVGRAPGDGLPRPGSVGFARAGRCRRIRRRRTRRVATVIVILLLSDLLTLGRFERRAGGAFLLGIAMWSVARAIVATTWRDPAVVGPLNMGQVLATGRGSGDARAAGGPRDRAQASAPWAPRRLARRVGRPIVAALGGARSGP